MRTRPIIPGLLVISIVATVPGPARADLRGAPNPVTEAGCDVTVELDGPIARVTERHRLVPAGAVPALASYGARLAAGAVVEGFSVTVGGRDEPGLLVPVESLEARTPTALGLSPDLGVLRLAHGDDDRPTIDVQVYPVTPARVTGFTLRWSAPMVYADGVMSLTLPARGSDDDLGRCQVRVDARAAAGVRGWGAVRVAGVWVGAGTRVRGHVSGASPDTAVVVEGQPLWKDTAPILAVAHAEVGGRVASTIGIYLPLHATRGPFAPPRLLFLVDTSRSTGEDGRRAALALVDSLGRAAPPGTPVEAVLFDRTARRALGTWVGGDIGGLDRLGKAIRAAPAAGGSDLAAALRLASDVIGDEPVHVVIITDGMLPVDHTGAELLGHFPARTADVVVDVIVPLAGGAAAPEHGALDTLTDTFGGRVLAFPADRPMPAEALTDELATGLPLEEISVTADGDEVDVDGLPDVLAAGSGVLVSTELERRPKKLVVHAERGKVALTATAIALPAGAERLGLDAVTLEEATAQLARARAHHVVSRDVVSVVIDRRARGGAARIELARRTGLYTYNAPPEELATTAPASASVRVTRATVRHIGELPRDSVLRALRDQLAPRLRICYRDALRAHPRIGGQLDIELEIARGEVMAVNLRGDHFPESMIGCIADVAYQLSTPTYDLGGVTDAVYLVRKPVTFAPPPTATEEPSVLLDDILHPYSPDARPALEVSPDAPL